MPGVATAQLLTYDEIVEVDLDTSQDVNFADVEDYGHRVVVDVNSIAINNYLGWQRNVGSARPSAKLNVSNETAFKSAIEAALSDSFIDIDGVTGGLHFGTANFDTNTDPRKRSNAGVSVNDIPMCFVLYKLYGSSAVATLDNIYNLQDAHDMLSNETVANAITESFKNNEAGSLDTMFRDLLAADPHRFFDSQGIPMTGIFETNADVSGSGSWNITGNDTIEVKLKLVFQSKVSRRGVGGREHNLSSPENNAGPQENQQTIINPSDYFYIRLQMRALAPPSAPTILSTTAEDGQIIIFFTPGANGGKIITNYEYSIDGGASFTAFSPAVTSSPVTITGLTNGTTYNIQLRAVNAIGYSAATSTVSASPKNPIGIYATGSFTANPLTIYNTPGTSTTISTLVYSGSNNDCFIVKYDKSGVAEWATRIAGNASNDIGYGITADSSGNLYVTGGISAGPMTFYDSPGTSSTIPTISGSGCFVVKYNPNGIAQWATRISGLTSVSKIAVDSSSNIYVIGIYNTTCIIYDSPGAVTTMPTFTNTGPSSSTDCFIVKYNTNGIAQWATRITGTSNDDVKDLNVDSSGNVYIIGNYASTTLTIYNSPGTSTTIPTLATTNTNNTYVVKYNTNGIAQWATRIVGNSTAGGISVDSSGNVYVSGGYSTSPTTIYNAPGTSTTIPNLTTDFVDSCFVVKFNTNGIAQWATRIGNTFFASDFSSGIDVDISGNIYVTGRFISDPLTIYNSPGTSTTIPTLTNSGPNDCFVVKYNTNGTAQWAARIAGADNDIGNSISVDSSGNLYVTGYYSSNTVTIFNSPGTSTTIPTLTKSGSTECFIAVFNTNGVAQWATRIGGNANCIGYSIAVL